MSLASRTFGVSETCCSYSPKLRDENEEIAGLLVGLTEARRTWGVWAMFSAPSQCPIPFMEPQKGLPDLLRTGTEPADQTPQAAEARQTRRAGGAGCAEYDHNPWTSWLIASVMAVRFGC